MEKILMRPIRIRLIKDYIEFTEEAKNTNDIRLQIMYNSLLIYTNSLFWDFFDEDISVYVNKEKEEWY